MQLIQTSLQLIVTHQLPMEKLQDGVNLVLSGKESIKVVLIPPHDD